MYCERNSATIPVATCLKRQKLAGKRHWIDSPIAYECKSCEQGKLAAAGKLNDDDVQTLRVEHGARSMAHGAGSGKGAGAWTMTNG